MLLSAIHQIQRMSNFLIGDSTWSTRVARGKFNTKNNLIENVANFYNINHNLG